MVFGEALVRAYELESTIARFPRVVISKEVMGDINRKGTGLFSEEKRKFDPFIEQADDGPYYVHELRKITAEIQSVQLEKLNKRPEEQEMRLLSHRDEGLNSPPVRPSTALGLRRYRPCPNARQSGRLEP
jgi:hypothetical protein